MKKNLLILASILFLLFGFFSFYDPAASAGDVLAERLSGRILLAIESRGEAWYVNPSDQKRYYLKRPDDAFALMKKFGTGITDIDLSKISTGQITGTAKTDALGNCLMDANDLDGDCLPNNLEGALGTDPQKQDSDGDGYDDKVEISAGYDPLAAGKKLPIDDAFSGSRAGKIFLQVEKAGQAWYINPVDNKKYFLGRPADAFSIMKGLGLGITDNDLKKIEAANETPITPTPIPIIPDPQPDGSQEVISAAASAIRSNDLGKLKTYFTVQTYPLLEYISKNLDSEQRLTLGNILSGSSLTSSSYTEKIYTNKVYFSLGGYDAPVKFVLKKQPDGRWLMTNL